MKPSNEPVTQDAYNALASDLQTKGVKSEDITKAIGSGPEGKTRKDIETILTAWIKTLPKG